MKMQECENKMELVKSENEVVERVTTTQVWLLRAESKKGNNVSIIITSYFNLLYVIDNS